MTLHKETKNFVTKVNALFDQRDIDLKAEESFPQKRLRKLKMFFDENTSGVTLTQEDKYRIEVFNTTYDTIIECIRRRFSNHKQFYMDFECLHPSEFFNIDKMPNSALETICTRIRPFFPSIDKYQLRQELEDFASKWPQLSKTLSEEYAELPSHDCDTEEDCDFKNTSCKTCKNCIVCCYNVLYKYNLYAEAYSQLFQVYKYILTLSVSQVSCERSFSKLKFILNRLRNNLAQTNIEAFMLMATERDILMQIENDDIIKYLITTSKNLSTLLSL